MFHPIQYSAIIDNLLCMPQLFAQLIKKRDQITNKMLMNCSKKVRFHSHEVASKFYDLLLCSPTGLRCGN